MSVQPSLPSWKVEVDFVAPEIGIVVKGFLGAFEKEVTIYINYYRFAVLSFRQIWYSHILLFTNFVLGYYSLSTLSSTHDL